MLKTLPNPFQVGRDGDENVVAVKFDRLCRMAARSSSVRQAWETYARRHRPRRVRVRVRRAG